MRLGLEDGDTVVRQRVIQKVLFLAEELDGASKPASRDEVAAFYSAHRDRWQKAPRIRFSQVFAHDRAALEAGASEPGPIPSEMEADAIQIKERLGEDFAVAITAAPIGEWSRPVASAFGWHRFKVASREPGGVAPFEDVRAGVAEAYSIWRREEAIAKFVAKAASSYRITIDGKPARPAEMPRRIAARSNLSGED